MHALRLRCRGSDRDWLAAELWELGTLGIREHDDGLEAYFEEPFEARRFQAYAPAWREEAGRDWVAESQSLWEPLAVGERFFLVPDWRDDAAPAGRQRLTVHAGSASGSGYSRPTQLALEALERHLRPGDTVLDVGTGSGILASAALLLGAGKAIACDIEHTAAQEARKNLLADGMPAMLFTGSPRSVSAAAADLVVANLDYTSVVGMVRELRRVLRPGARLIAAGIRTRRLGDLGRAFEGMEEISRSESEGWGTLVLALPSK